MRGERTLVASEEDMGILEESRANHIGESMILLIESEDRTIGGTCNNQKSFAGLCARTYGYLTPR